MPNKEFIETYPLYRKFHAQGIPKYVAELPTVRINMYCPNCQSNQTFEMKGNYVESILYPVNIPVFDSHLSMKYECVHCKQFQRLFLSK